MARERSDVTDETADDVAPDPDPILEAVGFDAELSVLTRRQAEVLALRERGHAQAAIAERLGTSRANVASVEGSARTNVERAEETVAFARALSAPVRVALPAGTDLYDVPEQVYEACDEADVKVTQPAPDLMKLISDAAGDAIRNRTLQTGLLVGVTADGTVEVRRHATDG